MTTKEVIQLTRNLAIQIGIDPDLAVAICGQESDYICSRVRYEEKWIYLLNPKHYADALGMTPATETMLQKFSWGGMQVMGSVARELGYMGFLTDLVNPEIGITLGCRKLRALIKKYSNLRDAIASYNAGSPRYLDNGIYVNQSYVESVIKRLNVLKSIGG